MAKNRKVNSVRATEVNPNLVLALVGLVIMGGFVLVGALLVTKAADAATVLLIITSTASLVGVIFGFYNANKNTVITQKVETVANTASDAKDQIGLVASRVDGIIVKLVEATEGKAIAETQISSKKASDQVASDLAIVTAEELAQAHARIPQKD